MSKLPDERQTRRISKFLSLILRHNPDKIGITLDEYGWTDVKALIHHAKRARMHLSMETLE
ncbi:MAG: RNA 2'-phosphotransferase, partial [Bacteroidota bacterium]